MRAFFSPTGLTKRPFQSEVPIPYFRSLLLLDAFSSQVPRFKMPVESSNTDSTVRPIRPSGTHRDSRVRNCGRSFPSIPAHFALCVRGLSGSQLGNPGCSGTHARACFCDDSSFSSFDLALVAEHEISASIIASMLRMLALIPPCFHILPTAAIGRLLPFAPDLATTTGIDRYC